MKSKISLILASFAVILASCNKEEVGMQNEGLTTKSFTLNVGDGIQTRGHAELSRYVMEIYEGTTATGIPAVHKEQATGTFANVVLKDKQAYTVLFWADYGTPTVSGETPSASNEYDATDLKAARIVAGKQPNFEAYAGASKFTVGTDDEAAYTQVALTHAVAQVQFKQTEALVSNDNTLVVKYPESYSLNVDGMGTTKIGGEVSHSFIYGNTASGVLGTDYLIASTTTSTVMSISTEMTSGGVITTKESSNIPFRRNWRTTLWSAYSDLYSSTLTVTNDSAWETPDNNVSFGKWTIGSLYPNATNPIGIVFWLDSTDSSYEGGATPKGLKGKIVSLDEADAQWCNDGNIVVGGATSETDGAANTTDVQNSGYSVTTVFPAVAWCVAKNATAPKGIYWYLPAIDEMTTLFKWWTADSNGNNSIIASSGVPLATPFNYNLRYWSSTTDFFLTSLTFLFINPEGIRNESPITLTYRVRAISSF